MATGGTIPSTRQQTVTFYNTTGVIEREKNIYLVPRFSKYANMEGYEVRDAFITALEDVCPPSSAYEDIEISGWLPQDRTLVVKGNIDDFRLVTEEGECLNYFIIKRTVWKEDVNLDYYYGFFITGVEQAGGSSVRISCVPDDLTNVFYLHNKHVLSASDITDDYEPFNEKMKNCYVNRQHYDRLSYQPELVYENYTGSQSYVLLPNASLEIRVQLHSNDSSVWDIEVSFEEDSGSVSVDSTEVQGNYLIITIKAGSSGGSGVCSYEYNEEYWKDILKVSTNKVFLNQEESFKFKYQYRDMKYPISIYSGNFTNDEISQIESATTFDSLSGSLRAKIVRSCISYLVVETKSPEIAIPYYYAKGNNVDKYRDRNGQLVGNSSIRRSNPVIVFPYLQIPEVFQKFNIDYEIQIASHNVVAQVSLSSFDPVTLLLEALSKNALPDYIYSVYNAKDVNIPLSRIQVNITSHYIRFDCDLPNYHVPSTSGPLQATTFNKGIYISGLMYKPISDDSGVVTLDTTLDIHFDSSTNALLYISSWNKSPIGIMVSGYDKTQFNLTIEETYPDLTTNYYDPVLEAEPYKFYSLTYLSSYELPFNKNRYFIDGKKNYITLTHYVSFNGAVKESYVAKYRVEGYSSEYFNEALTFTTSSSLALVSDSYSTYYYQNQAQMKNQFAVNDYNRGVDLAQHFFISGPNAVGYSAGKGGMSGGGAGAGAGALLETGNQVMQMVDEGIDWAQSNKNIEMNQKAKLADMGAKPDVLKQAGSDLIFDLNTNQYQPFLNHYRIDELSYNSIAKLLERTGYKVNLYDTLHVVDRVGWNFIKLNGFDWALSNIMTEQEESIRKIFLNGVTLLHDKSYLTSGHNYEKILEEGGE